MGFSQKLRVFDPLREYKHHPLVPLPSLSERYTPKHLARDRQRWPDRQNLYFPSASPGVYLPSAYAEWGAHLTRVCLTRYVPLTGFFTLSAVFFSPNLPGFFHPGTLLGFSLQSLPFRKSGNASSAPTTLLPFSPCAIHGWNASLYPARARRNRASRLQGFVPFRSPFSRAWGLAKPVVGALLGFCPLQGFVTLRDATSLQKSLLSYG